jgi:hypothetical protein
MNGIDRVHSWTAISPSGATKEIATLRHPDGNIIHDIACIYSDRINGSYRAKIR